MRWYDLKKKNSMEDYVDKAIKDNDFSEVSDIIEKSVEAAIDLTRTGANAIFSGIKKSMNKKEQRLPINRDPRFVKQKVTSHNGYMWLRNFSLMGTAGMGLATLAALFEAIAYFNSSAFFGSLVCLIMTIAGLLMSRHFHNKMKLEKNFNRYRLEVADNRVVAVEDFATAVSLPPIDVVKDLQKLISDGYFPQGRIVENGQLFLLDQGAYKAYKENYKNTSISVKENPRPIEQENKESEEDKQDDRNIAIGKYIENLSLQIDSIKNVEFKDEVGKLLSILHAIKKAIQQDPGRIEDLNKFVDYYTPTTIKLIDRYIEFEQSPVPIDSMNKSRHDIEKSIKTVVSAYENLLNDLYKEDLLELSAEMDVMNTVLTQDGLIGPNK